MVSVSRFSAKRFTPVTQVINRRMSEDVIPAAAYPDAKIIPFHPSEESGLREVDVVPSMRPVRTFALIVHCRFRNRANGWSIILGRTRSGASHMSDFSVCFGRDGMAAQATARHVQQGWSHAVARAAFGPLSGGWQALRLAGLRAARTGG